MKMEMRIPESRILGFLKLVLAVPNEEGVEPSNYPFNKSLWAKLQS